MNIKSVVVQMDSDDNFNTIVVMIPLTDALKSAIKRLQGIIENTDNLIDSITINPSTLENLTFASEQTMYTFRSDSLESNKPIIVKYALKSTKKIFLLLSVTSSALNIRAVDDQDFTYGGMDPIDVKIEDIMK